MHRGFCKPRIGKHFFILGKSIGVTGIGSYEHIEAESRRGGRRDAVFVRHKLKSNGISAGLERVMDAAHQRFAGRNVEMMKDIREQNNVVAAAEIRFKGASGTRCVAAGNAGG